MNENTFSQCSLVFNWQSDYALSVECTTEKEIELNSHEVRVHRSNIDTKINIEDNTCIYYMTGTRLGLDIKII